jgi:hypothetical protein
MNTPSFAGRQHCTRWRRLSLALFCALDAPAYRESTLRAAFGPPFFLFACRIIWDMTDKLSASVRKPIKFACEALLTKAGLTPVGRLVIPTMS